MYNQQGVWYSTWPLEKFVFTTVGPLRLFLYSLVPSIASTQSDLTPSLAPAKLCGPLPTSRHTARHKWERHRSQKVSCARAGWTCCVIVAMIWHGWRARMSTSLALQVCGVFEIVTLAGYLHGRSGARSRALFHDMVYSYTILFI